MVRITDWAVCLLFGLAVYRPALFQTPVMAPLSPRLSTGAHYNQPVCDYSRLSKQLGFPPQSGAAVESNFSG